MTCIKKFASNDKSLQKFAILLYMWRRIIRCSLRKGFEIMGINFEQIFKDMLPALESKRSEFYLYGYTTVTREDIWRYCLQKVWRKKHVEEIPIHQIVNDILQISPAAFMTFTQIEAQRDTDWFSDLNSDELQMLLGPRVEGES